MTKPFWLRNGKIIVNENGKAVLCDECPCPGEIPTCAELLDVYFADNFEHITRGWDNASCSGTPDTEQHIRSKVGTIIERQLGEPCKWCGEIELEESINGGSWQDRGTETVCAEYNEETGETTYTVTGFDLAFGLGDNTFPGTPPGQLSGDSGCYDEVTGDPPDGGTFSTLRQTWALEVT